MRWILLLIGLPALLLNTAVAKEFIPHLGVTVEENDNINKTKDNVEADTVITPYFGFLYEDQGPQLDASVDFEVRNERFSSNSANNQNLFSIDSFIDWVILPNRFVWAIEDVANTQRISAFEPASPDNLQNFNVFTTGPDYIFSSGSYEGLLKLRLGDVYYSDTGADNQRIIGSASAKRLINEYSSLGISSAISLVDFEEVFRVDYDIGFLGVTYERDLPYGTFELSSGVNWVAHDNGTDESAPMGELEFEYDGGGGGANVLRLAASTKYSDPALDAYDPLYSRTYDVGAGDPMNANQISGDGVFSSDRIEAGYIRNGKRIRFNLLAYLNNRESLLNASDADVEEKGYNVGLSYLLRDNLSLWVGYNASDNNFKNKNSTVKGMFTSAGFDYSITQHYKLSVGASDGEENSEAINPSLDTENDDQRDFSNTIFFLRLEYRGVPKGKE
jgi:hypothetical protein